MSLWKKRVKTASCISKNRFNPCFRGCRSERLEEAFNEVKLAGLFQSLFSWMSLWKSYRFHLPVESSRFQSLFSWMSLWKRDRSISGRITRSSQFQSLFSWMSLWKRLRPNCLCERLYRFQSLFSWMSLWKTARHKIIRYGYEFQSLFSWMSLWKWSMDKRNNLSVYVSILVFVDVALKDNRR